MLDYLLSTGLYDKGTKKHPYRNLYDEERMIDTDKTVSIAELVERFIEINREYNGESWNIRQILANINMIISVEDRTENKMMGGSEFDNRPQCCIDHDKWFSTCDTCEYDGGYTIEFEDEGE